MKTKEELNALKEEVETQNKELHELTEEKIAQVTGGLNWGPFNDATVSCCWCNTRVVIYKDRDIQCFNCKGLLRASLYE